ncbi:hypothetical protein [Roseobacter weihaiensis]|uniref:hypothetical protein n=1 Tax=Roseobacter weihaiensis TaxID=2763262 RepID=UPI001D0AABC6|nr:hypothetical protein [Roseobacter sp. H9]
MTATLSIPAAESGLIRVFALSLPEAEAKALKTDRAPNGGHPVERALGAEKLVTKHVEVFPISDLGDMSLPDYLTEGAGAAVPPIDSDRAKLMALEGWVMIVYSSAFGGNAQDITPQSALTLIGTYAQEGTDWTNAIDIETASAVPQAAPVPEPKRRPSDAAMSGRIAMLALLVAFAVVGLMLWVGS